MSSLSWTLPLFQSHELTLSMSLVLPPVKMSSLAPNPSVMKRVLSALSVPALTLSQSSGSAAPELSTAFPSSSKRFVPTAADTGAATAKLKYCISSESTKSADQDRARPRRLRALMTRQTPRDAMVKTSRSPRQPRSIRPLSKREMSSSRRLTFPTTVQRVGPWSHQDRRHAGTCLPSLGPLPEGSSRTLWPKGTQKVLGRNPPDQP